MHSIYSTEMQSIAGAISIYSTKLQFIAGAIFPFIRGENDENGNARNI